MSDSFIGRLKPITKHDTEGTIALMCSDVESDRLYAKAMINMAVRAEAWVALELTFLNAPIYVVQGMRPRSMWEHDRFGRVGHDFGFGSVPVKLISGSLPPLKRLSNPNGSTEVLAWQHCTSPWQTSIKENALQRVKYLEELKAFAVLHPEFDQQTARRQS